MVQRLTILISIFLLLGVVYLILFSKGSVVNWLIKNGFVGKESKPVLMQLDMPFLNAWKTAAAQGLAKFNYGNISGYNTRVGQVLTTEYGKTK